MSDRRSFLKSLLGAPAAMVAAHELMPVSPAEAAEMAGIRGQTLGALNPDETRKLWARGAALFEQSPDFFKQFEGSPSTPILCQS